MDTTASPESIARFVALDVHKHYVMVAAIDAAQQVVLAPRKLSLERFAQWAPEHLQPTDQVVLEATANAWTLYDQLAPLVQEVKIAHPLLVKLISAARVKTDTRDTLHLARLLAAGLIPTVWVPPAPVRELRLLVAHRQRLVRQRTQAANRLHSVLHARQITPPPGRLGSAGQHDWWDQLPLAPVERLRVQQDRTLLQMVEGLIATVDAELARLSTQDPWKERALFLMQLPGFAVVTSMTVLAAIGDITRFPSAKKLVGYSGLGASVHASGQTYHTGPITKQGRRELRTVLVEAAWSAVEHHPHWHAEFVRLVPSLGKAKAIVAIARKLLVVAWHVLTHHEADRHADWPMVTRKLQRWGAFHGVAEQHGLSRGAFARQLLDHLGMDPATAPASSRAEGGEGLSILAASGS
jgi:transposase